MLPATPLIPEETFEFGLVTLDPEGLEAREGEDGLEPGADDTTCEFGCEAVWLVADPAAEPVRALAFEVVLGLRAALPTLEGCEPPALEPPGDGLETAELVALEPPVDMEELATLDDPMTLDAVEPAAAELTGTVDPGRKLFVLAVLLAALLPQLDASEAALCTR